MTIAIKKKKFLGVEWGEPYNPLVLEILKHYKPKSVLFAITTI